MASTVQKPKVKSQEEIVAGFQELRQQQRAVASKINELEMDMKEHELVLETLKEVDEGRKCYRMVGGVLVDRTVKDVLPALKTNKEQMGMLIESLMKQMEMKGREINKYREEYNLVIRGEESKGEKTKEEPDSKPSTAGVLVAKDS